MKKTTIASLMATAMVLPQLASGAIILAGWHQFTNNTNPNITANSPANEGVSGIYDAPSSGTNASHRATTTTGGSTDGWYGPDSTALGGVRTEQPFTAPAGGYTPETTNPAGPRLQPGFNGTDTAFAPSGPGTNFDGRIAAANGTDITVTNGSQDTYYLHSFVFDAFLGDVSAVGASGIFQAFTFTVTPLVGPPTTVTVSPSYGVTGYNSTGALAGSPLDTVFPGPALPGPMGVPNAIDYGTGTNYVDYVINLGGLEFAPGATFTIGFVQTGTGTVRLDNLALFAVPEPSSVMTLAALVGSGCFFRRRKLA
jgi:hypothetical protein